MTNTEYVQFTKGQRVKGRYCGGEFTGTITNLDFHTINADMRCIMVRIDGGSIDVAGKPCDRSEVMLSVGPDGREMYQPWQADWLEAA